MEGMTRANAMLVEQASAATWRMQECALGLAQALLVFQIDDDVGDAALEPGPALIARRAAG